MNDYIPDPIEILQNQIEKQFDLVDENDNYPCCKCGRKFPIDSMFSISEHSASPLECGRQDCINEKN